jgi:hypothetical protein
MGVDTRRRRRAAEPLAKPRALLEKKILPKVSEPLIRERHPSILAVTKANEFEVPQGARQSLYEA